MERIIVYGTGKYYRNYKNELAEHYEIVGITNSDGVNESGDNIFIPICDIEDSSFDKIYIATYKLDYYMEMRNRLIDMGVPTTKIVGDQSIMDVQDISDSMRNRTSLTDSTPYVRVCNAAVEKNEVFERFRSNRFYKIALEHVSNEIADRCVEIIEERNTITHEILERCVKNDLIGQPDVRIMSIFGRDYCFSPTTIRYVKIADEIVNHVFNGVSLKNVAEIGIGYGGQNRILQQFVGRTMKSTLIDLPEVINLADKYLKTLNSSEGVTFVNGLKKIEPNEYDLVISNYAFSELTKEAQNKYLEEIVCHSKHGYMCWNSLSNIQGNGYSIDEIRCKIPGSHLIEERPLSAAQNCVLVW